MTTLTRRDFLQAVLQSPAKIHWPDWMPRMAFAPAQTAPRGDVLLVVFLRGAADALNMLVPYGEDAYYSLRPSLGIPRSDDLSTSKDDRVSPLDDYFGLHPALGGPIPAWEAGHLAPIHAVGAPDESRSHFKAMELMERGVDDERGPASGWIGRHLATLDTGNPSPLRAIGLGRSTPLSLRGAVPISALQSIADFHLGGDLLAAATMRTALHTLYQGDEPLALLGQETLEILSTLESLDPSIYQPAGEASYPDSDFGRGLQQIAMLIKADAGLEVAALDLGGWDTHFGQGSSTGLMAGLMSDLGDGLGAFHTDMFEWIQGITVVVMSEFGRRAYENASLGTDHGHGSMMLLMGGNVYGSRVHGVWPGLAPDQLFGPGDLAVTTDYRDVLSEILSKRLNNKALEMIFPDFKISNGGFVR